MRQLCRHCCLAMRSRWPGNMEIVLGATMLSHVRAAVCMCLCMCLAIGVHGCRGWAALYIMWLLCMCRDQGELIMCKMHGLCVCTLCWTHQLVLMSQTRCCKHALLGVIATYGVGAHASCYVPHFLHVHVNALHGLRLISARVLTYPGPTPFTCCAQSGHSCLLGNK
jgi:hypothetical protein